MRNCNKHKYIPEEAFQRIRAVTVKIKFDEGKYFVRTSTSLKKVLATDAHLEEEQLLHE